MSITIRACPLAAQTPADWRNKILHATFALADQVMTGADIEPEHYQKPQGFAVLLSVDEPAETERIFATLAENGVVQMALQKTFWAARFGQVIDQVGTPWMIHCGNEAG
jgi:PhnB protein